MFTSKIVELVNKNFESVQPMLNLDSIYFEQAISSSTDDSSYTIERQSIYKHTVPLVNGELSKKVQGVILVDSSVDHIESDERILISSPLNIFNINSSYIELKSTQYYCLNDLLSNYVTNSSFEETYNNTYDKLDSSIKQYYIDNSSILIDNLQKYYEDSCKYVENAISNFKEKDNSIKTVCLNISEINSETQTNLKTYDNEHYYINKKLAYEFNIQLLELLNISDEKYRYEIVYIWEVFQKMMLQNLLKVGKTYNILYYPRTKIVNNEPYEYNKFSIPIILEVTAISESKISNNVKVKNSIDTITTQFKQDYPIFNDNDVIDIINVYNFKEYNKDYRLKPILLSCYGDDYLFVLYYDDKYGFIEHSQELNVSVIPDNLKNDAYYEFAKNMANTYTYSVAYISTLLLRYCLYYISSEQPNLFDNYDNSIIQNLESKGLLEVLRLNLQNSENAFKFVKNLNTALEQNNQDYLFNLEQTNNIFYDTLKRSDYNSFINDIYNWIDNNKYNYIENIIAIILNYFQESLDILSESVIHEQISYYIRNNSFENYPDYFNAINIYYDTHDDDRCSYDAGLLYNGDAMLYGNITNVNSKFDNSKWIFKYQINEDSIYTKKYSKVLQGGKVIPYENWKMSITTNVDSDDKDKIILSVSHLIDEYNNECDYDFRSIPLFVNDLNLDGLPIFADDLFWQTYYRMAANTTFDDELFNVPDIIMQNYTPFETSNNKILNNTENDQNYGNKQTLITCAINTTSTSIYIDLIKSIIVKDQNLSNINILNNTYNCCEYCVFTGTNFNFINNTVEIGPLMKLFCDNSDINNSNITITDYNNYNVICKNSVISYSTIEHKLLVIQNSDIYQSTIKYDSHDYLNIVNSKLVNAINYNDLQTLTNSTLIGLDSQRMVLDVDTKEQTFIAVNFNK